MGDKKKLPTGLSEKQELQRQESVNKVLRAADNLKDEGKEVTISALVEYTGLSRSTFAKPHIRELLVGYGYVDRNNTVISFKQKRPNQDEIIRVKEKVIMELEVKNAELRRECELLRGEIFLLLSKQ